MSFIPMQKSIVYGPISSKRLRRSLGVNLSPLNKKVCTFNCIYCHYGPTHVGQFDLPSVDNIAEAVEEKLKERPLFDYITFAGNGEPTLHPEFLEIVKIVRQMRDKHASGIPIALLSNSTQLNRGDVIEAANLIDFPIFKLDAGDNNSLHKVNRPVAPIDNDEIVELLCGISLPIIQTVMIDGSVKTFEGTAFDNWIQAIGRIRPRLVQLYTPDKPIVSEEIVPVAKEKLEKIARDMRLKMGFNTHAF